MKVFIFHLLDYFYRSILMNMPFHAVRLFGIKMCGVTIGDNCSFLMNTEIRNGKNVFVGSNSVINKRVLLDGRGGKVIIGENVDIAQETNIWTLEHDVHDDYHTAKGGDVIIGDFVWIASRVTILPGVKIGRGAVVASGSVVTRDVAAMQIVAGVPAKVIAERQSALLYKLNYRPWFK